VVVIALGIAATTALFSFARAILALVPAVEAAIR
jgi:hypothetical protein